MTVVGLRTPDGVVLAGDAAGTRSGWGEQRERLDAKTLTLSEKVAVAYCGSYRVGQVLRFHVTLPDLVPGKDEYEWAVKDFVPAARSALRDAGAMRVTESVERLDGPFLLAVRHRLFVVDGDFQVGESEVSYAAHGSGMAEAAGHFHALGYGAGRDLTLAQARTAAKEAVVTSASLNAYVGGKVTSVETVRWTKAEKKLAAEILA